MGLAAMVSLLLICCCVLSVGNLLSPNERGINWTVAAISLCSGVYVGVTSYYRQKAPRPASLGRCLDCGKELTLGQLACPLCGRSVVS